MKLTVGKVPLHVGQNLDQRLVSEAIQKTIMAGVHSQVADVSGPRVIKFRDRLQRAATAEAHLLFQHVVGVIDSGANHVGNVVWKDLSTSYLRFKDRYHLGKATRRGKTASRADIRRSYSLSNRFFYLSGRLRSYFRSQGRSIVDSRFGGVEITMTHSTERLQRDRLLVSRQTSAAILLADVNVKIFPRIAPSLMPMLASGNWSAVPSTNEFDKTMLPPGAARKLSGGKHGPYRPLVLPLTQFFILNRIPNAIRGEVIRSFGKTFKSQSDFR